MHATRAMCPRIHDVMSRFIFVVAPIAALLMAPRPAAAQNPPQAPLPTIVTAGEAVVRRAPDRAFITAAVESRAKSPREAQQRNADAMASIQQRLAVAGVPKESVRTLGYTIQQEFDFANGRRVPREYVARNAVEVRLDAIERTGEIIDAVVQAGATSVMGIRFDLRDRQGAEREALRLAVVDARERAEAAAAGAGRSIDRVIRIEDTRQPSVGPPRPMVSLLGGAVDAQASTPIEAGEIEIRAQVLLTVTIK